MKVYNNDPDEIIITTSESKNYELCKTCMLQSDGTVFSNMYNKTCCAAHPYPGIKPPSIIDGKGTCEDYIPVPDVDKRK